MHYVYIIYIFYATNKSKGYNRNHRNRGEWPKLDLFVVFALYKVRL